MQKEFDIKWKSHDLSGSASLALWANMNQSTTQLGSKRQSQGKHLYPTINIFICCAVIICPVSIYFYVSSFSFSVVFAQDSNFFFLIVHFHQDGFHACSHLALLVSLFKVFVELKFTVCPPEVIQCFTQWIFISMDFFHSSLVEAVIK